MVHAVHYQQSFKSISAIEIRNDKKEYLISTYIDHGCKIKTDILDLRVQNIYGFLLRISLYLPYFIRGCSIATRSGNVIVAIAVKWIARQARRSGCRFASVIIRADWTFKQALLSNHPNCGRLAASSLRRNLAFANGAMLWRKSNDDDRYDGITYDWYVKSPIVNHFKRKRGEKMCAKWSSMEVSVNEHRDRLKNIEERSGFN